MQKLISEKQARAITGGRKPLVPIEYEIAIQAVVACTKINEAKYWDNLADAQAAWAKIHKDNKLQREARALKIWAFRRMGQISAERKQNDLSINGARVNGARALLKASGLSDSEAHVARTLARAKQEDVERLMALPRPPSPSSIYGRGGSMGALLPRATYNGGVGHKQALGTHEHWGRILQALGGAERVFRLSDAAVVARSLTTDGVEKLSPRISFLIEWLDEFEQHLPKEKAK